MGITMKCEKCGQDYKLIVREHNLPYSKFGTVTADHTCPKENRTITQRGDKLPTGKEICENAANLVGRRIK